MLSRIFLYWDAKALCHDDVMMGPSDRTAAPPPARSVESQGSRLIAGLLHCAVAVAVAVAASRRGASRQRAVDLGQDHQTTPRFDRALCPCRPAGVEIGAPPPPLSSRVGTRTRRPFHLRAAPIFKSCHLSPRGESFWWRGPQPLLLAAAAPRDPTCASKRGAGPHASM